MENILVESTKKYYQGFILKEQDFRRIMDLILVQLKKISEETITTNYTLKFENGSIAQTDSIETILNLENIGSTKIIRIETKSTVKMAGRLSSIELNFKNCDSENESGYISIDHSIKSDSRDWVFVTSSLIEERILQIKRFAINQIGQRGISKLLVRLFVPLLMLLLLFSIVGFLPNAQKDIAQQKLKKLEFTEKNWKDGKVKDPIRAILDIEIANSKEQLATQKIISQPNLTYIGWIVGGIIAIFLFMSFLLKYYLVYNFCWGDYEEQFNKKESIRKFVFVVIILGLILSIVGGLITNYISLNLSI